MPAEPDITDPPADVATRVGAFTPALDVGVPEKALDRNLLIATWNLRPGWAGPDSASTISTRSVTKEGSRNRLS